MATKRKASALNAAVDDEPVDPSDELAFYCLGGGNEVGRSCHIIQYKGKTVMLDAGMHPAKEGFSALPFFDEFDLSTVDVLLISQYVRSSLPSSCPLSCLVLHQLDGEMVVLPSPNTISCPGLFTRRCAIHHSPIFLMYTRKAIQFVLAVYFVLHDFSMSTIPPRYPMSSARQISRVGFS
jgi:cleavage and polyadenylation specificity factor subunit 3